MKHTVNHTVKKTHRKSLSTAWTTFRKVLRKDGLHICVRYTAVQVGFCHAVAGDAEPPFVHILCGAQTSQQSK